MERIDLKNLTREEMTRFIEDMGEKPFRAGQILKWIYKFGVNDFDAMTDISRDLRSRLAQKARIGDQKVLKTTRAEDGTTKLLWGLEDGSRVESVLIPERGHQTLCVSSQVGCAMGCRFCRTAGLGLKRNLTTAEIVGQVLGAVKFVPEGERLTNLVFMGMGEPLANRKNVVRALGNLTEPGLADFSRRHISVSTVGLIPELPHLAAAMDVGLTVSLNAPNDDIRSWIMPINQRYPMKALHRALSEFPLPRGRRITIAYVLLSGVNDSEDHAVQLTRYLHGLRAKVNLIPFNAYPGSEFGASSEQAIQSFQEILINKNYTAIIRKSKGRDVSAACGQLAAQSD